MQLVDNEFFQSVKANLHPGTVLIDATRFVEGSSLVKVVLSVVLTKDDRWTLPMYVMFLGSQQVDGTPVWAISPWFTDNAINCLATLIPPSLLFARLSPDDSNRLVAQAKTWWPELSTGT